MDLSDGEGEAAEDAMGKKGEDGRRKVLNKLLTMMRVMMRMMIAMMMMMMMMMMRLAEKNTNW